MLHREHDLHPVLKIKHVTDLSFHTQKIAIVTRPLLPTATFIPLDGCITLCQKQYCV